MVEYTCDKCSKTFRCKSHYVDHQNRKNPCFVNDEEKGNYFFCEYCDRKYNRKDNLTTHLKKCKIKLQKEETTNELEFLKEKIKLLEEKINNTKSTNIANTNLKDNNGHIYNNSKIKNNNNINIIQILPFLTDDMSHLTEKDKKKILQKCYESIPELIRQVNFNPNAPQNHNVYISNLKSGHGHVRTDKKWVMMKLDNLLDDFINKKKDDIEEILDEYENELPDKVVDRLRDVIASIDYEPAIESDDNNSAINKKKLKYKKRILDEVKLILFNNKDIILNTKKSNVK
jgi:hypothetical protein